MVDNATVGSIVGMCTIVDAVTAVNTQTAVNGCAAGDGNNDIIDLSGFTLPTSIEFTQAANGHALVLTQPVTIKGALDSSGTPYVTIERSSVSGTPDFGLIRSSAALTLSSLSVTNGYGQGNYPGGAILAGDALSVSYCVITGNASGNVGGGIASTGAVTLSHSTISGNTAADAGGGIYSISSVHSYYSTISGNETVSGSSAGGGGIYSLDSVLAANSIIRANTSSTKAGGVGAKGLVTLSSSTVSGNTAQGGAGGGVFAGVSGINVTGSTIDTNSASGAGGGIYASSATLTNSTLTGNIAIRSGGGVYTQTFTANYCTIYENATDGGIGGGIDFLISGTANATILWGNSPDDLNTPSFDALSGHYDIIANSGGDVPPDTVSCNPQIGPLANFGGPTQTLPLLSGSCAINAASATPSIRTDQRGYARPAQAGNKADIGAFEVQSTSDPNYIFINGFD